MPNYNPRGRKKPTTLWPILDGKITARGRLVYLDLNLQIDPEADLEETITDFRTLLSQVRSDYRRYLEDCNRKSVMVSSRSEIGRAHV